VADLVIRNGLVVDGTGAPAFPGDVAVSDGWIVEVVPAADGGAAASPAARVIDADGLLVAPGWVDIHTHYDGQATWDPELTPSSWHGVTTTVFGNCSVGFAPVRPGREGFLINLMEGVADIPGSVLSEGIDFRWESFPEYLDALDETPHVMDIGTQVPHAALRFCVMGERGADHAEVPTDDEIAEMGKLAAEALEAGALGFSTSRTVKHRAADGRYTPSLSAADAELVGIAEAMGAAGRGVLQCNSDFNPPPDPALPPYAASAPPTREPWRHEIELLPHLVEVSGRPLSFSLIQVDHAPDRWRDLLDQVAQSNAQGHPMRVQVGARSIGVVFGLEATLHPFMVHATYKELAGLPLPERVHRLRQPDVREAMLAEPTDSGFAIWLGHALGRTFELGDPPNYEPAPSDSIAARAERDGRSRRELAYDLLLADEGRALLYHPFENPPPDPALPPCVVSASPTRDDGESEGSLDALGEMLQSPHTVAGLGDGGAHVGTICDASYPTTLLTHWVRDRTRGDTLPVELVVRRQTSDAAGALGFTDRGALRPGMRADVNVIDLDGLRLHPPRLVWDLPAGGKRLVQSVDGYRHTFVAGVETYCDGSWTGATPGTLVRGV
jgi:N-acyl-D-aspartate/D-glutamate deacylase